MNKYLISIVHIYHNEQIHPLFSGARGAVHAAAKLLHPGEDDSPQLPAGQVVPEDDRQVTNQIYFSPKNIAAM